MIVSWQQTTFGVKMIGDKIAERLSGIILIPKVGNSDSLSTTIPSKVLSYSSVDKDLSVNITTLKVAGLWEKILI